jgi:hypothetical protein
MTNEGDFQIEVSRSIGSFSKRNPADWGIEFKAVEGGIIEVDNAAYRTSYEAPESGYTNSCVIEMKRDNRAWFDNVQKVFFVKSRNGQVYSKVYANFDINNTPDGPMYIELRGVANPNGSRNWEEDESKIKLP